MTTTPEQHHRYNVSEKGRASRRRYFRSAAGKAAKQRWEDSPRGQLKRTQARTLRYWKEKVEANG